MIREMKDCYPHISLVRFCRLLGVTRQAHYQNGWNAQAMGIEHELVLQQVHAIRRAHKRMGGRKLHELLEPFMIDHGIKMGRDALFDLLADHRLLVKRLRTRVITTRSSHWLRKWPNLIKDLRPTAIGQVWVSDITYWAVEEGFYFIFLITDLCSHKIIGYHVAASMDGDHAVAALRMAQRGSPHHLEGIIHHSDRGSQYCFAQYIKAIKAVGMLISMTEDSDPRDNAVAERVNGILKNELLAHHRVANIAQAKALLHQAVRIYNQERPHMSCDMLVPDHAHLLDHKPKRRWKNYYRTVNLTQVKPQLVNPTQDLVL